MTLKHLTLALAAVFSVSLASAPADAGHRKKFRRAVPMDNYYGGPAFVHGVPGLRLFFGDYALSEEEFDRLYGDRRQFDERYYEPEPAPLPKPRKKKVAKTPAEPEKQASTSDTAEPDQAKSKVSSSVNCEKAGSIISGYGFTAVKPESCSGKLYSFNATRDGRNFAIKLDPKSGELTEVKKLN